MEGTSSPSSDNNTLLSVDEFYFSALHDDDEVFPISDEKYAQELQLQEALMSSAIASLSPHITTQPPKIGEGGAEPLMKMLKGKEKETGQSSEGFCGICLDVKSTGEMFRSSGCSHTFCCDCIGRYVGTKIQENISVVKCPDVKCKGELEPQSCKSIIPKEVFDRWQNALCESMFLGSQKVYCPFKDCSAMLVDDGEEVVTVTWCPHCWRMFCAQCKVAWHAGIE
ncbi:hypothetical protein FF2_045681 [Malus domestica]